MSLLLSSQAILALITGLLGLLIGSFLNVVIHRLPKMLEAEWRADCAALDGHERAPAETFNLVVPRSRCPACAAPITAIQNIPVLSWLWLRGKCATCRVPISFRYPAVEIVTGLLSAYLAWRFGPTVQLAAGLLFLWMLIALATIDLDTQLLPDAITFPLLWTGLLVNLGGVFATLPAAVLGAAGGYLLLWSVYWGFRLLTGKEGMGFGDFKLLAALGAWVGWQVLPFVILVGAGLGAVIGSFALWRTKQGADTRLPFGPYLAVGGLAGLLWGREAVIAWLGRFPG